MKNKLSFSLCLLTAALGSYELQARRNKRPQPQPQAEAAIEETIIEVMPKRRPEIQGHLIKAVSSMEEFDNMIQENPLVFVDFWSKSCGICELMRPDIQELSLEYKDKVTFMSVNLGLNKFMPLGKDRYKISGLPTYLLLLDGKRYEIMTGSQIKEGIRIYLDKMIKQAEKQGIKPQPTKVEAGKTAAEVKKPQDNGQAAKAAKPSGPLTLTIETESPMSAEVVKSGNKTVIELKEK